VRGENQKQNVVLGVHPIGCRLQYHLGHAAARAYAGLGPALRAAIMTPLFRHDPDIALRVLTTGMGSKAYRTLRPAAPTLGSDVFDRRSDCLNGS
jgi:hypothetical protein